LNSVSKSSATNTRTQPRPRATPRTIFFVLAACALVFVLPRAAAAKNWRGIVPLASTREDVERMLGQPAQKGGGWHFYDLGGEVVVVWFGSGKCDPWGLLWDVPAGTVTSVGVLPKRRLKVATLIDPATAKTKSLGRDYAVHSDDRAGLTVEAQDGFVAVATYRPGSDDAGRGCPVQYKGYYPHFIEVFDNYGPIPREDEWARLDNFANALWEAPPMRGVLVIYGGRRGRAGEAQARGARAKNYLVRVRKIEPWRITVFDGGHREEPTTELGLFAIGGVLITPAATPTVSPDELESVGRAGGRRGPGRRLGRRKN
jgi:hypothetical protein